MKLTNDTPPNGDYVTYVERLMAESALVSRVGTMQPVGQAAPRTAPAGAPPRGPATAPTRVNASRKPPATGAVPATYRAPPPSAAPDAADAPGAMPAPFNPAGLLSGLNDGEGIVKAVVWMVAVWFGLGIASSFMPELEGLVPVAVIGGGIWLFFKIKNNLRPEALAQWKTQLERAAAEAARQQRK